LVRGYDATLVGNAHTTEDLTEWGAPAPDQVIAHATLYWSDQAAPGRTTGTVATKDVDFGSASRSLCDVQLPPTAAAITIVAARRHSICGAGVRTRRSRPWGGT